MKNFTLTEMDVTPIDIDNATCEERKRAREFCNRRGLPIPDWAKVRRVHHMGEGNVFTKTPLEDKYIIVAFQYVTLVKAEYRLRLDDEAGAMELFRQGVERLAASRPAYEDNADKVAVLDEFLNVCRRVSDVRDFDTIGKAADKVRRYLLDVGEVVKKKAVKAAPKPLTEEERKERNEKARKKKMYERMVYIESLRATGRLDNERLDKYGFKASTNN